MSNWTNSLLKSLSGNKNLVTDLSTNTNITYDELLKLALIYGKNLKLEKSKVVTVVLPNSINYLITYLACAFYGSIFAPIPYFLTRSEIEKTVEYHASDLIISNKSDLSHLKNYLEFQIINRDAQMTDGFPEAKLPEINEEQVLSLYYSSGTTGDPKGVLYTHANKFALISSLAEDFNFNHESRHFSFLPFGHTASLNYSIFPSLYVGSNLFIANAFESVRGNFFNTLSKYQITYTQIVPTIAQTLIKIGEDTANLELSSIKFIGCGSAPLSKNIQIEFQKKFGIPLANLYGLSETGPSHFDNPGEKNWEPGSIGVPLSVNECKISEDGEILLKGKNVTIGYFQNETLTEKSIIDGWFYTGDYGYIDRGKYYFQDRKKDLIILGGINIYPAEIEDVIYLDNRVIDCAVFGIEDKVLGEKIIACVTHGLENQNELNSFLVDLNNLCTSNLSSFKVPSIIYFANSIPKTPSGKLKRREIKSQFLANQNIRND
jgi:acyl-CoA synthetase (AMP-forming)/AMP-acid ligase II